jgi:hypothetical protein
LKSENFGGDFAIGFGIRSFGDDAHGAITGLFEELVRGND